MLIFSHCKIKPLLLTMTQDSSLMDSLPLSITDTVEVLEGDTVLILEETSTFLSLGLIVVQVVIVCGSVGASYL